MDTTYRYRTQGLGPHATAGDLAVGSHLTSPRWGYVHHGLYAGNGRVIHYAGFNRPLRRGKVEEIALADFTRGRALQVQPSAAQRFAGLVALERARSRLGEDRYRFWTNNCEHFVSWCLTGTSRSAQVEGWLLRVQRGVDAVASWVAAAPRPRAAAARSHRAHPAFAYA
jgi:hypothetical protein